MKNKGITLVELLVAILISGFVILAVTGQFVAEQNFRFAINNQIAAENEAAMVMHYLTGVFRFAKPGTVATAVGWAPWSESVSATIEGGHLSGMAGDTVVGFGCVVLSSPLVISGTPNVINSFSYNKVGSGVTVIANDISHFHVVLDSANKELYFQVTATVRNRSCSLESKVRYLGT